MMAACSEANRLNINDLYEKTRAGDEDAEHRLFHILFVRFQSFVHHRISDRDDCNDIVQSAIMTISSELRKVEIQSSFAAWAYKILDNKILGYIKSKRIKAGREQYLSEEIAGGSLLETNPLLESQIINCLRKIAKVNPRYTRILNLHFQGYTNVEICKKLNIAINNAYVILSRARSMLQLCLEKGDIK